MFFILKFSTFRLINNTLVCSWDLKKTGWSWVFFSPFKFSTFKLRKYWWVLGFKIYWLVLGICKILVGSELQKILVGTEMFFYVLSFTVTFFVGFLLCLFISTRCTHGVGEQCSKEKYYQLLLRLPETKSRFTR